MTLKNLLRVAALLSLFVASACGFSSDGCSCSIGGVNEGVAGPLLSQPDEGELPDAEEIHANTPMVYFAWNKRGLEEGDNIRLELYITELNGATVNSMFSQGSAAVTGSNINTGHFNISPPPGGFPVARYRADFFVDAEKFGDVSFEVLP